MLIDCHNHVGVELQTYLRGEYPYAQHLTTLRAEGLAHKVERFIVFPMVTYLALNLSKLRQGIIAMSGELEVVPYAWENRRFLHEVYDLFPQEAASMIPFLMVDPSRETAAQAKCLQELRRQYRFYGFKIQSTLIRAPIKHLLEQGRVFLELAEEWNLPFLIHSSVLPEDIWAQASDILDVAALFPRIRFCAAHSLRFDGVQLDRLARMENAWFDCSAHKIHCDLAQENHAAIAPKSRRFDSDFAKPNQVLGDLASAYPDKLLWGSDSPYYSFVCSSQNQSFNLRSSYETEANILHTLSTERKQSVAHDNTLRFLGLKSLNESAFPR